MAIPSYLDAPCFDVNVDMCPGLSLGFVCMHAVKQNPETGRWYITIGHPGFNSDANNGAGYVSKARAMMALRHFAGFRSHVTVARARRAVRCADCGLAGEMTGHMTCQYPQDR